MTVLLGIISWIGTAFILAGLWYVGDKKWWAFGFSIIGELLYIIYAFLTPQAQFALAFLSVVILGMAIRNLIKWRREEQKGSVNVVEKHESQPRYYFISYEWRRPHGEVNYSKKVIKDQHPVDWYINTRRFNNENENVDMGITFWAEITEKEYERWDGEVG